MKYSGLIIVIGTSNTDPLGYNYNLKRYCNWMLAENVLEYKFY